MSLHVSTRLTGFSDVFDHLLGSGLEFIGFRPHSLT